MRRSFKYRLWTNANQERELSIALETNRRLYNLCLDYKQLAYQCYGTTISYFDMCKWFTSAKCSNVFFARLDTHSARETMRQLDRAFDNFFRRVQNGEKPGYPRFKGKDYFNSFTLQDSGWKLLDTKLRLQHVGTLRIKLHRPVQGKIKTVTLKREADKWYVIFSCDMGDVTVTPSTNPPVGIDVGLESFLTTSTGEHVPNPRYLKKEMPRLRRVQRSVARKKKGGHNRRKMVRRLRKVHARIRHLRHEQHHQVALSLVRRYGLIAVERLNVRGMLKNHRLARAISDAGWTSFMAILKGKAESAGVRIVEVDAYGTSQECSGCGATVCKDLSVRQHDCPHCKLSLHRDDNAAKNILARGLAGTLPAEANVGHKAKRSPRSRKRKQVV